MSRYYRAAFEYLSELPRKHRELVARTGEAGGYSWPSQCRGVGELLMFKLCSHALLGYLSNTSGSIGNVGDVEGLPGSGVGGGSGGVDRTSSTTLNSAQADEAAVSTMRNHLSLFSDTKVFGTTQAASSGSASPGLTDDGHFGHQSGGAPESDNNTTGKIVGRRGARMMHKWPITI